MTTSGCDEDPAGVPTCTLPATLFDSDTATVTITGTYSAAGGTVTATATSTSDETNVGNNSATISLNDIAGGGTPISTLSFWAMLALIFGLSLAVMYQQWRQSP